MTAAHTSTAGRRAVERLAAALTGTAAGTMPPHLDAALDRVEAGPWPEVAWTWSRLTPSGCPVELATDPTGGSRLYWAAEVCGPQAPEADRLRRTVTVLAEAGQAPAAEVVRSLAALQHGADLRFGAWVGGREDVRGAAPARLKLYAELAGLPEELLARPVLDAWRALPAGTVPRMFGIEPATGKSELYARLPITDPLDLMPFLHAAGHLRALNGVRDRLPGGLDRLAGRRLGVSVAWTPDTADLELCLFVTARTLFPGAPELLGPLVPRMPALEGRRLGSVTLRLDPTGRTLSTALALSPRTSGLGRRTGPR
ncbi:hypothetical protein SAMN04489712_11991 [Thermomonospora echinospora]|uniref:Aromatic prenyltransferase, DMATS type n=1 Tax=Thermomonospora echinospora TaxID=1992 RepID=A0A1H6DML4_9ACTN|nr:hypothetical protein [Thermomonospora echinospora]SEG86469.1 hypothetical protein SAMN04489712_11991 [Thermomonospora echinospora]